MNCVGPRACYDEGKRVAEALTYGYLHQDGVDVCFCFSFLLFLYLSLALLGVDDDGVY